MPALWLLGAALAGRNRGLEAWLIEAQLPQLGHRWLPGALVQPRARPVRESRGPVAQLCGL